MGNPYYEVLVVESIGVECPGKIYLVEASSISEAVQLAEKEGNGVAVTASLSEISKVIVS